MMWVNQIMCAGRIGLGEQYWEKVIPKIIEILIHGGGGSDAYGRGSFYYSMHLMRREVDMMTSFSLR